MTITPRPGPIVTAIAAAALVAAEPSVLTSPVVDIARRVMTGEVLNPIDGYAYRVASGEIPAGKYHRLACERHLRDREREGTPAFPYRFDLSRAERFFRFAGKLKHYKGEWAGKPIVLEPYQKFRLGSVFGWVHVETGLRRFRTAYNEIPRKNGKSLEAAIVAVYVSFYDQEPGAEGYTLATKLSQAMLVFADAKKLVQSSGLKDRIKIQARNLNRADTASKLEPLGANPVDGLNPHLICIDEMHQMKTRELMDVMETATGARRQPLNFQITTAGDDMVSPCGDQHDYAVKVLEQVLVDETFFGFIASADPGDDWTLDTTARKANPNYGVSIKPDDLRSLVTKAIHMPSAAAAYQQKRLNLWVNTAAPWLSLEGWRAGQSAWSVEELRGASCFGAIDLASKIDLAAFALLFPPTPTRTAWRYLVRFFTPADTLVERAHRDRVPYQQWTEEQIPGSPWPYLTTNAGNRLDQDVLRAAVADARELFGFVIQQVGFDPWNAGNLEKDLQEDGVEVLEIPQTLAHMSAPAKEFEADVLDGLVDTGANPMMAVQASNVVVYRDGKDNIYPQKKKSRGRIDGIIACIIARKLAGISAADPFAEFDEGLIVI
jgi:phage terminase large subunit-like protein